MSHESTGRISDFSYYYLRHPKKQMDNEYRVIFLPDNGKSRSMKDKKNR